MNVNEPVHFLKLLRSRNRSYPRPSPPRDSVFHSEIALLNENENEFERIIAVNVNESARSLN